MRKAYNLSTQLRMIADMIILSLIIIFIQNRLIQDEVQFLSSTKLIIVFISVTIWFFSARTLGLYEDFREIPFSHEWIVFLKTLVLYSLLVSFIFFTFLNKYPF